MSGPLTGYRHLLRLALRQDRLRLALWVWAVPLLTIASYVTYEDLFPDAASREVLSASMASSPAVSLILGPGFELATAGGFTAWRSIVLGSVFIALMVSFTLVRHTRSDEDSGRAELVSSGVVGRHARLAAATTLTALESLAIGAVAAALLMAVDAPAEGAAMIGAAYASVGLVFSGVAAVAAQVGAFSRTSNSIAILVVGVTYLLRGFGDSAADAEWVSWLSPLGWAQRTQPFAEERWEVLALPLAATVLLVAVAHLLLSRRDLGMGMVAPRTGPAEGSRLLGSSFGLAWRLHAGTLLAWCAGFAVTGLVFGGLASSVADMLSGSDGARDLLAGQSSDLTDAFLTAVLSILGITTAAYGTQAVLRARSEEIEGRVDPLLATPVSRWRWIGGHLLFASLGSALVITVGGVALGLSAWNSDPDMVDATDVITGALVQIPAIWVLVALAAALVGLAPKFAPLAWAFVGSAFILTFLGPMLDLDQKVLDLSPFSHVPEIPGDEVSAAPLATLAAIAAALLLTGLLAVRRRDIARV